MSDGIKVTILEDGTIRLETDAISPAQHLSAEQLVSTISRLSGGEVTITKKRAHGAHVHVHGQQQESEGA